jgi:LmbE family N-acetylglucosaminyl deacetylase
MEINKPSRRDFMQKAGLGLGLSMLPLSLLAQYSNEDRKLNIICVGGHPDDPESGCGGTLAKFSANGHNVTIIYLTRGEAGIEGKFYEEASAIRTAEAKEAGKILGAKSVFAGQIDGSTIFNNEWIEKIQKMLEKENPDIVFSHWPLDAHRDHQAAATLTFQAWLRMNKSFELYFFEVNTGSQTMIFSPTDYVDITLTQEQKKKAVLCHKSQDPESIYSMYHYTMEKFRGTAAGVKAAEAFIKMPGGKSQIIK